MMEQREEEDAIFVPVDDTVGDLVVVEDLMPLRSAVFAATPTASAAAESYNATGAFAATASANVSLGRTKMASSWWRTSLANLRRPRGEGDEAGEGEREGLGASPSLPDLSSAPGGVKKSRAGLRKRFATAEASIRDEMKKAATKSSPDIKKVSLVKKESSSKKRSGKADSPTKSESEAQGEKSEAAEGKPRKDSKEKKTKRKERKEKAVDEAAAGQEEERQNDAAAAAQDERRLQRSRSLSSITQVAEEMELAKSASSKELEAVTEELKGPLPVRADMTERQRKRNQVINEIVNTERAYVRDLQALITVFIGPMQTQGIVTAEDAKLLFSNVKTLLAVNQTLLSDLIKRVETVQGNNLGESFLLFSPIDSQGDYLRMYTLYCSNQDASRRAYAYCMKTSREFRTFMLLAQCHPDANQQSLDSFLIKPVQRLCKYPLLLRELIGVTDSEHKDFERLNSALEKIRQVVSRVNDSKKAEEEMEAMAKVVERLQGVEKFGFTLMEPGRKFLQEGSLHREVKGGKEMQPSYYVLFSDLLVLCKRGVKLRLGSPNPRADKTKYDVSTIVPLISAETEVDLRLRGDELGDEGEEGGNDTPTDTTVEITHSAAAGGEPNKTRQFVVQFASAENKRKWVQAYRSALDRHAGSPRPRTS